MAILGVIQRYRIVSLPLLLKLVAFNPSVVQRRLRDLYDQSLVNRFALPRLRGNVGVFHYYLDNPRALDVLIERGGFSEESLDREFVRRNREKSYANLLDTRHSQYRAGSLFWLQHELAISSFHGALELACRHSNDNVQLSAWRQGASLWTSVLAPSLTYDRAHETWRADGEPERLPHRPDALFSLRFPDKPDGQQDAHFFYEQDRGTTSAPEAFRRKLRAYFHSVVRHKQHREQYGIQRVRAVLVEAIDRKRARRLHEEAQHPAVCGGRPTPLFWFGVSETLHEPYPAPSAAGLTRSLPRFLVQPERVLEKIWVPSVPNPTRCSLLD